ncbi:MAG: hypothetical protein ACKOC5_05530 [Chloroflexota bacterium]
MSFRCPQCLTRDSLEIRAAIELPPTPQAGETSLQVVSCDACSFRGLALYEEMRGGAAGVETWKHIGYWVSPDAVDSIQSAIAGCPDSHNPRCNCPAHLALAQHDLSDSWRGLLEMERGHTFAMRLYLG